MEKLNSRSRINKISQEFMSELTYLFPCLKWRGIIEEVLFSWSENKL
jgi:hypothetical protein